MKSPRPMPKAWRARDRENHRCEEGGGLIVAGASECTKACIVLVRLGTDVRNGIVRVVCAGAQVGRNAPLNPSMFSSTKSNVRINPPCNSPLHFSLIMLGVQPPMRRLVRRCEEFP